LLHGQRRFVCISPRNHHQRTGLRQAACHAQPNAPVAAGDDCDFSTQIKHALRSYCR
jgi:hypothetical protein